MSKNLEQLILALPCDGATTLAIIGTLKEAGLADATVYGLCETCGGSGTVTGAEDFPGGDEGYDVTCSPCPDCTGTVSVVTKELRERVAAALYNQWPRDQSYETLSEDIKDTWRRSVDITLSTVLGKTLVVKEMLTGTLSVYGDGCVYVGGKTRDENRLGVTGECVAIAILEDER